MKFTQLLVVSTLINVGICFALPETPVAPQSQASFTAASSNTWNLDWLGSEHRIYYVQASVDLVSWDMLPVLEFGTGPKGIGVFTDGAPKFFVRLEYYDDPLINSLTEAKAADGDFDGISNWDELTVTHTDPTNSEDPGGDDDLLNRFEHDIGSNPRVAYELGSITGLQLFLPTE